MAKPGDPCPKCGKGRIRTRSSHPLDEQRQVRYLECQVCEYKTKSIIAALHVWRRSFVPYKQP